MARDKRKNTPRAADPGPSPVIAAEGATLRRAAGYPDVPAKMVELLSIDSLIPDPRNSKRHTAEQAARLAGMIREFGFTDLLLIDGDNVIRAGHGRKEAVALMREQGLAFYVHATDSTETDRVPCVRLSGLSPTKVRALVIANNRSAEVAGSWDMEALRNELDELGAGGFDMAAVGYTDAELDALLDGMDPGEPEGGEGGDEGASGATLQFGGERVPLTPLELASLRACLRAYEDETGGAAGFGAYLAGPR